MIFDAMSLRTYAENTTKDVFQTMLSIEINEIRHGTEIFEAKNGIAGKVEIIGELMNGVIVIHMQPKIAKELAAKLLMLSLDKLENSAFVSDFIGELTNMISGGIKSDLVDSGLRCDISLPVVMKGDGFNIDPEKWDIKTCFSFYHDNEPVHIGAFFDYND